MRPARVDPAGRPIEGRRRQAILAGAIIVGWLLGLVALYRLLGPAAREGGIVPWLLGFAVLAWAACEHVGGRRGLVWPGSALAIAAALSAGLALSAATPEIRAAPPETQVAAIAGGAAAVMAAFLFRFRLPGLVSPVVTFTIVALFFGVWGADPARLAEVEGFSPRGILAAMLDSSAVAAIAGTLALAAAALARRLDFAADDFALAAARPLHVIGCGILALVVGRWLGRLPAPLALAALAAAWAAAAAWALRVNRISVMLAAWLAMTRPAARATAELLGVGLGRGEWAWILALVVVAGIALWPLMHRAAMARGWTVGPGGRIPVPRDNWWWRYWPYA